MALILGRDIATTTGFAWYEPGSSLRMGCSMATKSGRPALNIVTSC